MQISHPYLLFLGNAPDELAAKTARGIAIWRPEWCLGQLRFPDCKADLGLEDLDLMRAREKGAKTLVLGTANPGGVIPDEWLSVLMEAIDLGYDIANGLHQKLADIPSLASVAATRGCQLFDVRHPRESLAVGNGKPRAGKRLLTVGTDCSVGKMFTTLALEREMRQRGMKADFRATGQTGILISGSGISIDAVVADFISGAAEAISPANTPDHWDLVEGQGSLFHPSFAGVSLGLLHGAAPDALVMCHEPKRPHMRGLPHYGLPELEDCMDANLRYARRVNPEAQFAGLALNSSALPEEEALGLMSELSARFDLPCVDPVRQGVGPIVDRLG